jgi:hypothetical protein
MRMLKLAAGTYRHRVQVALVDLVDDLQVPGQQPLCGRHMRDGYMDGRHGLVEASSSPMGLWNSENCFLLIAASGIADCGIWSYFSRKTDSALC